MNRTTAAALMTDSFLRRIFEGVMTAGVARLEELGGPAARLETAIVLCQFRNLGLVAEKAGVFAPTAKGLEDHRHLRAFEQTLENF